MTTPETLLGAVADAIATADVDGATYEDLARAALSAHAAWHHEKFRIIAMEFRTNDQEDDGA